LGQGQNCCFAAIHRSSSQVNLLFFTPSQLTAARAEAAEDMLPDDSAIPYINANGTRIKCISKQNWMVRHFEVPR
jgi:hypothetical protein